MKSSRKNNGGIVISAWCGGQLRKVGKLVEENGRPVFVQKIDRPLKIFGCCGIDLRYEPELPENCLIRHIVKDGESETVYEIPLSILQSHPKTDVRSIGHLHPKRQYLPYRYWKNATLEAIQPRLFEID